MAAKAPFMKIADDVSFGRDVRLAGYSNLFGCTVGDDSFIGPFVEIQRGVSIGARVKVQSHSFICEGVTIADEAFIGHGVMFTNDLLPRATTKDGHLKGGDDWHCTPTRVGRRAAIGNNATIVCGVTIGPEAIVGAGAVVTKDVPARAIVAGNPAKLIRYLVDDEE